MVSNVHFLACICDYRKCNNLKSYFAMKTIVKNSRHFDLNVSNSKNHDQ